MSFYSISMKEVIRYVVTIDNYHHLCCLMTLAPLTPYLQEIAMMMIMMMMKHSYHVAIVIVSIDCTVATCLTELLNKVTLLYICII